MFKIDEMTPDEELQSARSREIDLGEWAAAKSAALFPETNTMSVFLDESKISMAEQESYGEVPTWRDRLAEKNRTGVMPPRGRQNVNYISREEFENKNMGEFGATWRPDLSVERAQVEYDNSKALNTNQAIIQAGSTPAREALGFGLGLALSVPDPINLMPGAAAKKGATVGRTFLKTGLMAAAENVAVDAALITRNERQGGQELTAQQLALSAVFGFTIGGAIGGGTQMWLNNRASREISNKSREVLVKVVEENAKAIEENRAPNPEKIAGYQEAIDEVLNSGNKERVKHINDNAKIISEALGIDAEDARAQLVPVVLHAEYRARETGESVNEILSSFRIQASKNASTGKAQNMAFKISKDSNADNAYMEKKLFDTEIEAMAQEVEAGIPGERSTAVIDNPENNQGKFKYINTSTKSTYPKWYQKAGVRNKDHFFKVIQNKKGPIWERLKEIARDRLENGGLDGEGIPFEPSNEWRQLQGLEPINLQQNASRVSGKVIEFDGLEGVIRTEDGRTIYFDEQSINTGRAKPGVGETVEFDLDDAADFDTVGTLFQSRSRRNAGIQVRQKETPVPDDFINTSVSRDLRVDITTRQGIRDTLEFSLKPRKVEVGHTGELINVGSMARNEIVHQLPKIKDSILKSDHLRVAKNPNVFNEIINNSVYLEKASDTKGRAGNFKYYFSEVSVGKRDYLVELEVRELDGRLDLYNWKLGRLKNSPGASKVAASPETPAGRAVTPDDKGSVSQLDAKLNDALESNRYMQDAENPRGQIDFTDAGESIVTLHKGADNTTVLHETGHFFLNSLQDIVESGKASKQTLEDFKSVNKWLDSQDYKAKKPEIDSIVKKLKEKGFPLKGQALRKYARDQVENVNRHEFFARGFEAYALEGNAPSMRVARVFDKFREWFRDLYSSRSALNADITPEMRDVYSRLMGGDRNYTLKTELPVPTVKTPTEALDTSDFDNLVESYNQGELDDFTGNEVQKAIAVDEALDKALEFYKIARNDITLFQGESNRLKEVAEQLDLSLNEAKKLSSDISGFNLGDDPATQGATLASIVDGITEALERQKFIEKRNAGLQLKARQNLLNFVEKEIGNYKDQGAIKDFLNSNATPERLILAYLEGDSRMRGVEGAGRAIFSDYQGLSQFHTQRMVQDLTEIDPNIEKILENDPKFQENIILEMKEIGGRGTPGITGDPKARQVAEVFSKNAEEMRQRLNEAGGDIGKLDGWVPRRHDYESLVMAKKSGWVSDVKRYLDVERSFPGASEKELEDILGETYDNLITGIHDYNELPKLTDDIMATPSNMAKRLGKSRKLHFKDSASELDYLKKYSGGMNIVETMFAHMDRNARMVSIMERLGPNPDAAIYSTIESLKKGLRQGKYGIPKDQVQKLVRDLPNKSQLIAREGSIGQAMAVITGETQMVQNVTGARIGSFIRATNTLSKLMAATLSQFSDAVSVTNEMRIINDSGFAGAWGKTLDAYFKRTSPEMKKEVLDYLGVISDGFNMASFNRFDGIDSLDNKMRRQMEKGFKLSGMTQLTNKVKSGFALALSKELGGNTAKSFDQLSEGMREVLAQYGGIDAAKWDIIRSANTKQVDGADYLTPDLVSKLDDEAFDPLLPEALRATELFDNSDSTLSKKRSAEIKKIKKDLESSLRSVFVEETRNAVLEPDARAMRTTTLGLKRGTLAGEAWRLIMQFKSFTSTYTQRSLGGRRMMKNKSDYGGVAHHALATMLLGYTSMVAKDISKGKEPRDPTLSNTWTAAMLQGGGLGIVGDLAFSDVNRFGGGVIATLGGPTVGVAEDLARLTLGNMHAAARGDKTDFASDLVNFTQYNLPIPAANLWYTRTALNYLVWYRLREALNPGSLKRMERRMKRENNQEYFWAPSEAVR